MQTDEATLRKTVAKNIAAYRKAHHDTQLDLATKLNYSDKSVSKWERGESLPDVTGAQRRGRDALMTGCAALQVLTVLWEVFRKFLLKSKGLPDGETMPVNRSE